MTEIVRDELPENLQGTYDDLNDFVEEFAVHHACIERHEEEIKRLEEEISPRVTLIVDWLRENRDITVFDEALKTLWDNRPDA